MPDRDTPVWIVTIRPRAIEDIQEHANYLEDKAPPEIAQRFRGAIMDALDYISQMPGAGSRRAVRNPVLSNLRMWVVPGFNNYIVFYITEAADVEVLRVLHGAQDIETVLDDEE